MRSVISIGCCSENHNGLQSDQLPVSFTIELLAIFAIASRADAEKGHSAAWTDLLAAEEEEQREQKGRGGKIHCPHTGHTEPSIR
jgi:hypothetical protein